MRHSYPLYGERQRVSKKIAPFLSIPQRQRLSVFSKYLSGTKPGLLVLNDVSFDQK